MRKVHQELSRGILADIFPAERECRGSEAVHELRKERQLAKRNVLLRWRFAPMAISTSSSQVGMGEAAGDGIGFPRPFSKKLGAPLK